MSRLRPPIEPMLARLARDLPVGPEYSYEPKWDGFRCLAFVSRDDVDLRSRSQRPLARYFPEVVAALRSLPEDDVVLDGELVIARDTGLDFNALLARLHPAASRVARLSAETPATFVCFDTLERSDTVLLDLPFGTRRLELERVLAHAAGPLVVCPLTRDADTARAWLASYTGNGIDGVVAKDGPTRYEPGRRVMTKVKPERTADCVVAGFRLYAGGPPARVSSVLLGLYEFDGGADVLRHIGVVSSFRRPVREQLARDLGPREVPLVNHPWARGFALEGGATGRLKGAAGRWTPDLEQDWIPIAPELVCEVAFDQVDGHRLRHPARWRRWRPDRDPISCRIEQLDQLDQVDQADPVRAATASLLSR